jgi:hypothetical protein
MKQHGEVQRVLICSQEGVALVLILQSIEQISSGVAASNGLWTSQVK